MSVSVPSMVNSSTSLNTWATTTKGAVPPNSDDSTPGTSKASSWLIRAVSLATRNGGDMRGKNHQTWRCNSWIFMDITGIYNKLYKQADDDDDDDDDDDAE